MTWKNNLSKVGNFWHYRFEFDGQVHHGSTRCQTLEEAKKWLRAFRNGLALREVGVRATPTLETIVKSWKEAHSKSVSPKHLHYVTATAESHFADLLKLRLNQITTEQVTRVREIYIKSPDHSPGGANSIIKVLNLLMGWAIENDYLSKRPYKVKKLRVQQPHRPVLPPEYIQPFLAEVDRSRNPHVHTAIRLMIGLGIREAEALGAKWEWIDWSRSTYTPGKTKGRETVPIPLPSWLKDHLEILTNKNIEGLILPLDAEEAHRPQFTKKAIARAGKSVGISKLTPHRMRATFATMHHDLGTPIVQIQRMLRHKDILTTMRYIEDSLKGLHEAQEMVARKMGFGRKGRTKIRHEV